MNFVSNRGKAYKIKPLFGCPQCGWEQSLPPHPWVGWNLAGSRYFDTWREAYDYARSPMLWTS